MPGCDHAVESAEGFLLWTTLRQLHPQRLRALRGGHQRIRAFWKSDADPKAVEAAYKELARFLPVLEQALAGRDWLEGEFSLADIAYAPHFAALAEGDEGQDGFDFTPTPNIRAWLGRMWSRPAWKKATEMAFNGRNE